MSRKVNLTIEFESDEEAHKFDVWIRRYVKVFDFQFLTDTSELYEKDKHFRELSAKYKEAKKVRNDYINEHNFKSK